MTDPERIAAGLSEAQRRAVCGKVRWMSTAEAFEWPLVGTVRRMREAPHKWEATPFGLAVRKVLENRHEG